MTIFILSFFVFLLLGVPIVFVLGLASAAYLVIMDQTDLLLAFPQRLIVGVDQFILLTVPLFILAGNIMNVGGISSRIIQIARSLIGGVRGGLGPVTVISSVFFAGISGSATAEAAAMGSILIPAMRKQGYPVSYASALVAVAATLGPIIPPSIAMVVFGALSGTSIGAMIITLPILLELSKTFVIDPVHLGVFVCINLVIGMATPPVGLCLFIVCAIGKVTLEELSRQALPLIGIAIAVLLLISYVPQTVLFLPRLMGL